MNLLRSPLFTAIGLLILRLGIGGYMLTHGWSKMQMVIDRNFEGFGDPLGIGPTASLLLVTFAEFFCALFVMIGAGTRIAVLPIIVTMAVAAFVAHGNDPWTMSAAYQLMAEGKATSAASKQPALMYLIPFLALFFTGAGGLSIDAVLRKRTATRSKSQGS